MHLFKNKYLLFYWILLFCGACQADTSSQQTTNIPLKFFDLKNHLQAEVERLSTEHKTALKVVEIAGEREEKQLSELDWMKEFSLLEASDINKIAWQDNYRLDTVKNAQGMQLVHTLQSGDYPVKKLVVQLSPQKEVQQIQVYKKVSNILYESQEDLLYDRTGKYEVTTKQKILFGSDNHFRVFLTWP